MNLHGLSFSFAWNGEGFVLISQILSAFSACFISKFSRQYSAVLLSGWQFVFGGAAMVICGLVLNGSIAWNGSGLLILLWLAFVSAGAIPYGAYCFQSGRYLLWAFSAAPRQYSAC